MEVNFIDFFYYVQKILAENCKEIFLNLKKSFALFGFQCHIINRNF